MNPEFSLPTAMSKVRELRDAAPAGKAQDFYQTIWDVMMALQRDMEEHRAMHRAAERANKRLDILENMLSMLLKNAPPRV